MAFGRKKKKNQESEADDLKAAGKQAEKAAKASEKAEIAVEKKASKNKHKSKKKGKGRFSNPNRRNVWLLVLTTVLVIGSIIMFTPPTEKINQGLDIQGGLSVVLKASSTDGEPVTQQDMEASRAIIEQRVNALGASEATVQVQGNDQILVQIPGLSDTETALATIGRTGSLEFARADSFTDPGDQQAIQSGSYMQQETVSDDLGNSLPTGQVTYRDVAGSYTPLFTGANITNVTVDRESQTSENYAVNVTLDSQATQAFAQATSELVSDHGQIVIVLDGQIQSAPAVQSAITDGKVAITGNYSLEEAQSLQTVLQSGSLPVSFSYEQSQAVGPTLGQDALRSGVMVALLGILLVILYLIFFYRGLGLLTAAAMGVFAVLYLGLLAVLSAFGLFSLSLAGIAGIVLTIGMAADSSILVLERFREEIRMGRSVRAASITGVRHAILTSIDADLVTMVSALTLFFLASASVKGFGMTLALGIMCDIVMMLILKAPLVRLLAPHVIAKHPGFWGINDCKEAAGVYERLAQAEGVSVAEAETGEAMNKSLSESLAEKAGSVAQKAEKSIGDLKGKFIRHDINFLGVRKILLSISAALIVLSFIVVGVRGLDFGIEFVGGSSITFHNTGDASIESVRSAFNDAGQGDAIVQTSNSDGANGFIVRIPVTSAEDAAGIASQVAGELGLTQSSYQVSTIGPDWGAGVVQSSLIAFVVSLLLIIIYIAIRFEYKMGIMAIVALLHDLIIVVGVYALFGREVTPNTIAALLTILGYSLYDTVVVFHRINDNMKSSTIKCSFMSMANHSLNQVFIRTVNTTLSSVIPVLGMLLFGGETLKDFAFAMLTGLLAGSYSSIAVATPLFAMWKSREPKYAKLARKYGSEIGLFTFASTPVKASVKPASEGSISKSQAKATEGSTRKNSKKKKTYSNHYRRKKK